MVAVKVRSIDRGKGNDLEIDCIPRGWYDLRGMKTYFSGPFEEVFGPPGRLATSMFSTMTKLAVVKVAAMQLLSHEQ
jgi:hypothetical protein